MNRSTPSVVFSNRLASRRLHRRPGATRAVGQALTIPHVDCGPAIVSGLPRSLVQEAGMFELLAAELRIAELEQALAEARDAALTDPLTGALNRRGFERASEREMARAQRRRTGFAIAYIDLDDFKVLNDTFGHQVGDQALVFLVGLLRRMLRPTDILSRFGGEEFVLMLPETSLVDATGVVKRFLLELSTHTIPGADRGMTFSAGVCVQQGDEAVDAVILRADAATYAAKRRRKNNVVAC